VLPRFFAPDAGRDALSAEPVVALPEDESTHVARVLRLAVGDSIRVFNGAGNEWRAEITEIAKHRVMVTLHEPIAPAAEARIPIVLAPAVLKGDKMDDVVRDTAMLGVASIQPLVTERTEISVAALVRSNRVERWQRIAISSCKQCGRAVVPRVCEPQSFVSWIAAPRDGLCLMLVEPGAASDTQDVRDVDEPESAEIVVGPEGGWTEREVRAAQDAGARLVTLGALTLRADAAALVALTALRTVWRDL
jgi:16S rRNA (uracil1498-N3)-methyltransferase